MKVTYRLPSKAIQYGFVEVEVDSIEELPDPDALGQMYTNYMYAYLEAEQKGLNNLLAPKVEAPPGDPEAATQRLAEGKKPRTVDEADEMVNQAIRALTKDEADDSDAAVEALVEQLGATVVEEADNQLEDIPDDGPIKPWEQEVKAKPKPWEQGKEAAPEAAVKVASIDW